MTRRPCCPATHAMFLVQFLLQNYRHVASQPGPGSCTMGMSLLVPAAGWWPHVSPQRDLSNWPSQGYSLPFAIRGTCRYFSFGPRALYFLTAKRQFFQYNAWCICQEEQKDGLKGQRDVAARILLLKVGSSLRILPWTEMSVESHIAWGTGAFTTLQLSSACLPQLAASLSTALSAGYDL